MNRLRQKDQQGLVAILIVSIIIIVLALITAGFAKIMDRNLRQSVDRALASQANYAAESGLNDARDYVISEIQSGSDPDTNGQCLDLNPAPSQFRSNGDISGDGLIKYSCIIINSRPKTINVTLKEGQSQLFKVVTSPSIGNLYFSWQNSSPYVNPDGSSCTPAGSPVPSHSLPQETQFGSCNTGFLESTVYSVKVPNTVSQSTYFMYPNLVGGSTPPNLSPLPASNNGGFADGNCNVNNQGSSSPKLPDQQAPGLLCNAEIQNVAGNLPGTNFYYIRLTALYKDLTVSIQSSTSGLSSLNINGAQAVIDVTGEGNDVLKRLEGRVPLQKQAQLPEYALQSIDSLCKRLRLPETGPGSFGRAYIDDNNPDQACQPTN